MKNICKTLALCVAALSLAACNNAKYTVPENILYIGDTDNGKTKSILMEETGAFGTISIRLANAAPFDVKVKVSVDEQWLEKYNSAYDASYNCVSEEMAEFDREVVIPKGSVSASPLGIYIKNFDTKGAQVALPIRITSDDVQVNEVSSRFIVVLRKALKQPVPRMGWKNGMQAKGKFPIELPNYTLEWLVKMSAFSINNQAIFNCGGDATELYCRFGDLVYANEAQGYGYLYNFFQVKTCGGQFDTGDPNNSTFALAPETWYHFAITRDSATGQNILYKDGELMATLTNMPGRAMVCDAFQMISSGGNEGGYGNYFRDYAEICQVRLWKTTRSQAQIQKNMHSEVRYDDPDLALYFPMNEQGSATQHDVTGNGYSITFGSLPAIAGHNSTEVTWKTYEFK